MQVSSAHRWCVKLGAWGGHLGSRWWLGSTESWSVLAIGRAVVVTAGTAARVNGPSPNG